MKTNKEIDKIVNEVRIFLIKHKCDPIDRENILTIALDRASNDVYNQIMNGNLH